MSFCLASAVDKVTCFRTLPTLALALLFAGAGLAQNASKRETLVLNGHTVDRAVVQIGGRSYVDVDAFARIMNASVTFDNGRVILTVPAAQYVSKSEQTKPGLSKEFAKAGVSQLAEMREWKAARASAIRFGLAGGNWLGPWLQ